MGIFHRFIHSLNKLFHDETEMYMEDLNKITKDENLTQIMPDEIYPYPMMFHDGYNDEYELDTFGGDLFQSNENEYDDNENYMDIFQFDEYNNYENDFFSKTYDYDDLDR